MNSSLEGHVPTPRPGLAGEWDRFVGPGASRAEFVLTLGLALAGGVAVPLYALGRGLGWSPLQLVVAALLALDLFGGVVANNTRALHRWYYRPGQTLRHHLAFIAVHGLHLLVVTWLFYALDWVYFGVYYACLLGAAGLLLITPPYLRRPLAVAVTAGAVLLNSYVLIPAPGLEWVIPLLFLKLVVGHLAGP